MAPITKLLLLPPPVTHLGLGLSIGLKLIREDTSFGSNLTDGGRGDGLADLDIRRDWHLGYKDEFAHSGRLGGVVVAEERGEEGTSGCSNDDDLEAFASSRER